MGALGELAKRLGAAAKAPAQTVVVGWPEDGPGGPEVAEIAAILMLGTRDGRIPPRPVLDRVLVARRADVLAAGRQIGALRLRGDSEGARRVLEALAKSLEEDVRARMAAGVKPDNAPSTVARKGVNLPLRDPRGPDRLDRHLTSRVDERK